MFLVFKILILTSIHFLIVICVPELSVQTFDKRLIQQKRQDTLDMCRLFDAENAKLNVLPEEYTFQKEIRRPKREAQPINAEVETAKRVEGIVDKLYEDLEENGKPVTYKRRNLDTLTTASDKDLKNKTLSRRFHFAPALLLGPVSTPEPQKFQNMGPPPGIEWPKKWKHAIVPYYIDSKTYDHELAEVIMKAFDYFEKATCIRLQRLRDRPTDRNSLQKVEWLYITNPSGIRQCVHSNERKPNKGVQMVVFGYDCMSVGQITHEVMHQLGFSHEHTRPDRDQHVTILWNNIKPGYKKYFESRTYDLLLSIPYDYASVLHYPPRAFSKNGQITVLAKPGTKLGQREGLSDGDVQKVGVIFGNDCLDRNRQYLLKTCPSAVKAESKARNVTKKEIDEYFKNRLWPYGVINYKLRDRMEFTAEEKENIKAVVRHIEKETCIVFRNVDDDAENGNEGDNKGNKPDKKRPTEMHPEHDSDHSVEPLEKKKISGPAAGQTDQTREEGETKTDVVPEPQTDDGHISPPETNPQPNDIDNEISQKEENTEQNDPAETYRKSLGQGTKQAASNASTQKTDNINGRKSYRRHAANILVLARSVTPGCSCPNPGKPSGNKVLKINADCFNSVNDLLHLFVHVLGLDHQHNQHDRDSYLHIIWNNLTPDISREMKAKLPPAASLGFDYDYQSVMHYPWLQIKDGVTNMMYPIWNDGWAMGHWQGLSSMDVSKINQMYSDQCQKRKSEEKDAE